MQAPHLSVVEEKHEEAEETGKLMEGKNEVGKCESKIYSAFNLLIHILIEHRDGDDTKWRDQGCKSLKRITPRAKSIAQTARFPF